MGTPENMILDASGQDDTQAQAIGTVVTVYGTAGIRTQSGELTILESGDQVFQNDVIATGEPGGLVIEFQDGSRLDLGRNSEAKLDEEVFDATLAQEAREDMAAEGAEVEAGLEDLNLDDLAPTAAGNNQGGGPGSEGSSFVMLDRSDQSTDPDSGLDSDDLLFDLTEGPQEESVLPVLANGPEVPEPPCDGEGIYVRISDGEGGFQQALLDPCKIIDLPSDQNYDA